MNGYPTDEELELLISQLENKELYAPRHMKEQILNQAFPKQTAEIFPGAGSRGRTVQTFTYRLKIIAGMAAALIMLLLLPVINESMVYREGYPAAAKEEQWADERQSDKPEQKDRYVNEIFSEHTREINRKFNTWFDQVNNFQTGMIFNREDGGIYYED